MRFVQPLLNSVESASHWQRRSKDPRIRGNANESQYHNPSEGDTLISFQTAIPPGECLRMLRRSSIVGVNQEINVWQNHPSPPFGDIPRPKARPTTGSTYPCLIRAWTLQNREGELWLIFLFSPEPARALCEAYRSPFRERVCPVPALGAEAIQPDHHQWLRSFSLGRHRGITIIDVKTSNGSMPS
jgi:hypothetical protein